MPSEESYQRFLNLLTQKQTELNNHTLSVISAISSEKRGDVQGCVANALHTAQILSDNLVSEDRPNWLKQYQKELRNHSLGTAKNHNLMMSILQHYNSIKKHQFNKIEATHLIDFEEIFQNALADSKVPELFDELVSLLNKIRDSNEVNNKAMLDAMEALIDSIKRGKRQSFISIISSKRFVEKFIHQYIHELAQDTPVLGQVYKAVISTYESLDNEIEVLQHKASEQIDSSIDTEVNKPKVDENDEAVRIMSETLNQRYQVNWFLGSNEPITTKKIGHSPKSNKDDD